MFDELEVPITQTPPPPPEISPELESARAEASRFGWKPQEDWTGTPEAWVDADKFLARGKDYNGYLKKQNEALQGQIDELRDTLTAFQDHHTKVAQKAYEKALTDLKTSRKQALKEGNLELVAELEDHIEQAQAEVPAPTKQTSREEPADPRTAAEFQRWVSENPWFEKSESARILADGIGRKWRGKLTGRAFLDQVAEEVRAAMPTLFENPARRTPSAVDGGRENGASKGKHSYSDLPAEAKKECDRLTKRLMADGKPVLTREQYLKEYFEEGEE